MRIGSFLPNGRLHKNSYTLFQQNPGQAYPHWLHIDFLRNSPDNSASDFIYRSLLDYINNDPFLKDYNQCVRHAYREDIQTLRGLPLFSLNENEDKLNERITDLILTDYKSVKPYVDHILKYATKYAAFFLTIDNVDQIEDDGIQSRIFTEAFAIARNLSLNLVLSLRQSTFAKHRNSPSIDAFDLETVQIDPPKISSVLSKRFALVKGASKYWQNCQKKGIPVQWHHRNPIWGRMLALP